MNQTDTQNRERWSGLEAEVLSELETLREIMLNLDRSWKDPAADLAKKAMNNRIQLLEEHFAEVRKRLSDPEYGTQEEM